MPHVEYHTGPVTPRQIITNVDRLLNTYLTIESTPDGCEYSNRADANLLQALFQTRRSFSDALLSQLPDIDWGQDVPLSPEEFDALCQRISTFADEYCTKNWSRLSIQARDARASPQALAGREILEDADIQQPHMNVLYRFGLSLRTTYLHKTPTDEERQTEENIEAHQTLLSILTDVVAVLGQQEPHQSIEGKKLLQSLISLLEKNVPAASIIQWAHETQVTLKGYECLTPSDALHIIAVSFQKEFGAQWHSDLSQEVAKVVSVGAPDSPIVRLLPTDNFYFKDTIGEPPTKDSLPLEGNCHHGPHIFHNASLFNYLGEKVFWGDLVDEEIRRIQGPYYVLNELDSYHEIPDWALLPEADQLSRDPFRPEGIPDDAFPPDQRLLRVSYIKIVALGKIEHGEFIENPTTIIPRSDQIDKKL
ncbi:hypothetical protein HYZ98_03290 [Candidatus Peregrinibacteria bacterium]|nr:hypothetical protein [Candidatus Peregrinibacteria bacterium]